MSHQISFVVKTVCRPLTFSYPTSDPRPLIRDPWSPCLFIVTLQLPPYSMSTPSLIMTLPISTHFKQIVHCPLRPFIGLPSLGLTPLTANSTPLTANSTALTANQTQLTANLTDLDGFLRRNRRLAENSTALTANQTPLTGNLMNFKA